MKRIRVAEMALAGACILACLGHGAVAVAQPPHPPPGQASSARASAPERKAAPRGAPAAKDVGGAGQGSTGTSAPDKASAPAPPKPNEAPKPPLPASGSPRDAKAASSDAAAAKNAPAGSPSVEEKPGAAAAKATETKPGAAGARAAPKAAASKGHAKAPAKSPKKAAKKVATRRRGAAGEPDEATRRVIAGTNASTKGVRTSESPELRALRELDLALFPTAKPSGAAPWNAGSAVKLDSTAPRVHASGVPPSAELSMPEPERPYDLSWLRQLEMPDIPVRWDARVVRYLEFYKNNPRGRSMVASWIKKSGRYGAGIRRILREHGLPEDIVWLALVESGFDPAIHSPAGAAGLWQFMPEGARIYGLTVDRWIDERLDPERSTVAAARYLADLRQRFGGWELAFAAYNMGYGGLLTAIRKYNTNDFWELSRLEAGVPLETALYVPKIIALAIVSRNRAVFGCDGVDLDPALPFDRVAVGAGVRLETMAIAAGAAQSQLEELNPQLLAGRTPPLPRGVAPGEAEASGTAWEVRVPAGAGARVAKSMPRILEREDRLERYVVRWGETIEDIAARRRTTRRTLASMNGLRRDEVVRPGAVLLVPAAAGIGAAAAASLPAEGPRDKPVVVVPNLGAHYPDRRRVFYRIVPGDTLRDLAHVFGVSADELCRWNALDPTATLQEGMTLQVFAPPKQDLSKVHALAEKDARVLTAGSVDFFAFFEAQKGRKRIEVQVREGDTWASVSKRYGLTPGMLERINRRSRTSALYAGEKLVVYVPAGSVPDAAQLEKGEEKADLAVAVAGPAGEAAAKEDDDGRAKDASDLEDDADPAGTGRAVERDDAVTKRPDDGVKPAVLQTSPGAPRRGNAAKTP